MRNPSDREPKRKHGNIIGPRLKQARLEKSPPVTQEDLVSLLEAYGVVLTQSSISKIEAGERPVYDYELKAIAEALVVPATWLIDQEEL